MTKEIKSKKRRMEGVVVSDGAVKTRVVAVTRLSKHPRFHKYRKVTKRFPAHDPENAYKKGDAVVIEETRPLSKTKRWVIVRKVGSKEQKLES